MIQCSFEEEVDLPGGGFRRTTCINKAEILVTSDPCFGLCYCCAYEKLVKRVKELETFGKSHEEDIRPDCTSLGREYAYKKYDEAMKLQETKWL